MRRLGVSGADGGEVLGWSEVAKGLVRSVMIESVGEGIDAGLEAVEAVREVVAGVELVSP